MASLTRGPPPLLMRPQPGLNVHTSNPHGDNQLGDHQNQNQNQQTQRAIPRDTECLPYTNPKHRGVGDTPLNTPAQPIAPRLSALGGGPLGTATAPGGGGGMGRPIGRTGPGLAHAATPGNTPSSLETMGRRIAGKLQGNKGAVGTSGVGSPGGGGDTRIAPSYERGFTAGLTDLSHRLATHQEKPAPAESPSSALQRLQLVSPTSTDQGKKADWPTSYDTDTNDGDSGQVKEGHDNGKVE